MKSRMFWLTKKAENKVVLRHCKRTEIRTEKTSTSSFPPKAMRLPHSPCFANIANGTLSKNPFNGAAKWIDLFPCSLWVNLQCSAVFSLVASRNDGHFLRLYKRVPPVNDPTAMPCLWALSKGETAVHGCHCLGDLAVCMLEVLARPWDGECLPLVLPL